MTWIPLRRHIERDWILPSMPELIGINKPNKTKSLWNRGMLVSPNFTLRVRIIKNESVDANKKIIVHVSKQTWTLMGKENLISLIFEGKSYQVQIDETIDNFQDSFYPCAYLVNMIES